MSTYTLNADNKDECSVVKVGDRMSIAVYCDCVNAATWNSAVLTIEVSHNNVEWFAACTLNGSQPDTLSADGFFDDIYVGDVEYVRVRASTEASSTTYIEVHWP